MATDAAQQVTSLVSNFFLVIIYMIFLLIEQRHFKKKLDILFPEKSKRTNVNKVLKRINESIMSYVSIKTFVSLLTGIASFIVLKIVGVDSAAFWALLIFFLNYIPSVGSLIATAFPVLVALVQFENPIKAVIVLVGILTIQTLVGNFLEPKLLGNKLNISTLVVLLSLVFWGMIWGVAGMFLCVPITVILLIVFNNFETTRPIAILLSDDGVLEE